MKECLVYVHETNEYPLYFHFCEGDGTNLFQDDIDDGYVDYILFEYYTPKLWQGKPVLDECDGGMILLKKLCDDMTMDEFVRRGLEFMYGDNVPNYDFCPVC